MKFFLLLNFALLFQLSNIPCQNEEASKISEFSFDTYMESYVTIASKSTRNNDLPIYQVNHNEDGQLAVNLALLSINYNNSLFYSNLSLMFGTYAQYNLQNEPEMFKNIFSAYIGSNLTKSLQLEIGILPSYIGVESAIGSYNPTLTRSMTGENSPYYMAGVYLKYIDLEDIKFTLTAVNGWQTIVDPLGNSGKGYGYQIQYTPLDNLLLNSSFYAGQDLDDDSQSWRLFHNFYALLDLSPINFSFTFDSGTEQWHDCSCRSNWYGTNLIASYKIDNKFNFALRGEYFVDKNRVLVPNNEQFEAYSISGNFDYINEFATKKLIFRTELKYLNGISPLLMRSGRTENSANFITFAFILQ